jgi:hypothetical protein
MFQHAGIWQAGSHPPQIYGDYKFLGEIIWNMHAGRGRGGEDSRTPQTRNTAGKIHYSFIHSKFESAYQSVCLFCTDSANIFYQPLPACCETEKGGKGERDTGITVKGCHQAPIPA